MRRAGDATVVGAFLHRDSTELLCRPAILECIRERSVPEHDHCFGHRALLNRVEYWRDQGLC